MSLTAYQEGKKYCTRCGECCKANPCLLEEADVQRIADHLGMPRDDFVRTKLDVERHGDKFAVRPKRNARGCIFLKGNDCGINRVKPKGGREFECWTPQGSGERYHWRSLSSIGVVVA